VIPNETLIWGRFHNWLISNIKLNLAPKDIKGAYRTLVALDFWLMQAFVSFCDTKDPRFARIGKAVLKTSSHDILKELEHPDSWSPKKKETPLARELFPSLFIVDSKFENTGNAIIIEREYVMLHHLLARVSSIWLTIDVVDIQYSLLLKQKETASDLSNDLPDEIRQTFDFGASIPRILTWEVEVSPVPINRNEPVTELIILMDPRLPDPLWRYYRESLHDKYILRRNLRKRFREALNEGLNETTGLPNEMEYPVLHVQVLDEREFFTKHFEKDRQKAAQKTWEQIRDEILRAALSEDKELRPLYVAFCEHAKLEAVEKRVRDADLLCSQGKYDAAVALCRQVAETLFKLMTGEPEEAPVDSKRIWNRKDDISGTYGERVFYDLANVWKDGSKLVHRPEANEAEMRYKARDIVGRTAHLWNMFKQRHFEYYGLPVTWQE